MRRAFWFTALLVLIPLGLPAGEPETKRDFTDLSRLIQKTVVKQLPKEFADASGWGQTIPAPKNLRFPRLRTYVKNGESLDVPHGAWRRFKGNIKDPDKNLKITVTDFQKREDKTYRLAVDVGATVDFQGEWQQWQKGLLLIGTSADGDADFTASILCDIGATLNFNKFPPELTVTPKVSELRLNLVDIRFRNAPITLKGDNEEALARELKEIMRSLVKAAEPAVKEYANRAIEQSLKETNGRIPAGAILKALPPPKD